MNKLMVGVLLVLSGSAMAAGPAVMGPPLGTPDYYGNPNWTFSPLPTINPTTGAITGGIHKFRNGLPGFCAVTGQNNLGQCLPIAVPDTATYTGSDYYKIELKEYSQQLHSDLPATPLRGYHVDGSADPFQYLGPVIIAQKDRPVRLKFTNKLTTDLLLPNDSTYMGDGVISDGTNSMKASAKRAAIHLHGGATPWISDGTPHQWVTPVGGDGQPAALGFQKGQSFMNVPDMVNGGSVPCAATNAAECITPSLGDGTQTLYWTNHQSGRMMFYHDHAYGITRLNVYAGEAAGYLLVDPVEEADLAAATAPGTIPVPGNLTGGANDLTHVLPIVMQDKTFVPDNGDVGGLLALTDPTWPVSKAGWGAGSFWLPHVYMPNQFPNDPAQTGANAMGRWDVAQWMNPAIITNTPDVGCISAAYPGVALRCPPTPNPSGVPETYLDTPLVNGTAYPTLNLKPSAYRFNLLNAANDRIMNLGIYYASTGGPVVTITDTSGVGTGAMATATVDANGGIASIDLIDGGLGYTNPATIVIAISGGGATTPLAPVIGTITADSNGSITAIPVSSPGSGYYAAGTVCKDGAVADVTACTEVSLIPANAHRSKTNTAGPLPSVCASANLLPINPGSGLTTALLPYVTGAPFTGMPPSSTCWPNNWPDDGNAGQHMVPRPSDAGPPFVQVSAEGGLLPQAVVIPSTPLGFEYNRRSATVLNGHTHGLLMGPAERAGVIVDFTNFAPKAGASVFILHNDGAAPLPGFDPRNDYFTGNPDQTAAGGAPSTLPGYGPNTRTLMQIVVSGVHDNATAFNVNTLMTQVPVTFAKTQDQIIVPETAYPSTNGGSATNTYPVASDTGITLSVPSPLTSVSLTNAGSGYTSIPSVAIANPPCTLSVAPDTTCTTAQAAAVMSASVSGLTLGAPGSGYTTAPTVSITGGGGTGASATATLAASGSVKTVAVSNAGSYTNTSTPTVTFAVPPAGGVQATGTVTTRLVAARGVFTKQVTGIKITNAGSGYTTAPALTFSTAGRTVAPVATSTLGYAVASVNLGNAGTGFTSTPTVALTGGGGTGATATAALNPAVLSAVALTYPGSGYAQSPAAPPAVLISGGGGTGATAVASVPALGQVLFDYKAVIEGFTFDLGRMNAQLGAGFAAVGQNLNAVAAVPFAYVDPTSDHFSTGDTLLWRFQHIGVDTHYIHFHLFNVQVINRIGIDGTLRAPNANELGWKETVRMNPFEDVTLAIRPIKPQVPWDLPNSIRMMDVTTPNGSVNGPANCQNNPLAPPGATLPNCIPFTISDPAGNAVVITNSQMNFGWEYVFHCHILGHEENDMMRPMSLAVAPFMPTSVSVTKTGTNATQRAVVKWTDNSINETGFIVQQAVSPIGPWTNVSTVTSTTGPTKGTVGTYTSGNLARTTTYYYRVMSSNAVGCTNNTCSNPFAGWLNPTANSIPTSMISVTTN